MVTVSSETAGRVARGGEGCAERSAWAHAGHWQRTLAARRADKQNTCFTAGASSRNFETCGNHNFGNNFTPWTLARAKERNPEICHASWLPSAFFCDVPPAHSVGVRKDTPQASPSGEYLFTRSKLGHPKEDCILDGAAKRAIPGWDKTPRFFLGRKAVLTGAPRGNQSSPVKLLKDAQRLVRVSYGF
jgi:hypothetical protein